MQLPPEFARPMGENEDVEYAVVDVETTGLAARDDRIVEIGIITLDRFATPTGTWSTLINPGRPMGATFIHGITDSDVADAPTFSSALPSIVERLSGRIIVGHNVSFDLAFLNAEFKRSLYPVVIPRDAAVCTMNQARIYLPEGRHSLVSCLERAEIGRAAAHRSAADALCSAALLKHYLLGEKAGRRYADASHDRDGVKVLPREWERAAGAARSLTWVEVADLRGL